MARTPHRFVPDHSCAREAAHVVSLKSAIRRQPFEAKWGPVRCEEPPCGEKQQVLLVEACDALYSTFAKRGRADKLRPSVPLEDPCKQLSAAGRLTIDHECKAFLSRF
jgi:hypothetical protein